MTPRRRNALAVSLVAAVVAGGFAFTYWVLSQQAQRYLRPSEIDRLFTSQVPGGQRVDPLGTPQAEAPRTTPATRIIRRIHYSGCGDQETSEERAGDSLGGRTAEELAALEPRATVESFSPEQVVLLVTTAGICPRHSAQRYLGIADGHVAVFQGLPGGGKVLEVFDLDVGALPEREMQDLRRGVLVENDDALKRMLQGLLELAGY